MKLYNIRGVTIHPDVEKEIAIQEMAESLLKKLNTEERAKQIIESYVPLEKQIKNYIPN